MPATYKIERERKLVTTTVSGVLGLATVLAHQDQILKDPEFDPSYSQLLDFTQVSKVELSGEDVRILALRSVFSPSSRRAILTSDKLLFGFARMFEMLRENAGEQGIRVFDNRDEARAWILDGKGGD
jgi:hypothetical protein